MKKIINKVIRLLGFGVIQNSKFFFLKTSVSKNLQKKYIIILSIDNMYKNFQSSSFIPLPIADFFRKKWIFFQLIVYNNQKNKSVGLIFRNGCIT